MIRFQVEDFWKAEKSWRKPLNRSRQQAAKKRLQMLIWFKSGQVASRQKLSDEIRRLLLRYESIKIWRTKRLARSQIGCVAKKLFENRKIL